MKQIVLLVFLASFLFADYTAWSDKVIKRCTKKFEHDFSLHFMGSGGALMEGIETLKVVYFSNQRMNVDQARWVAIQCSQCLIHEMNQEIRLKSYIKNYPFSAKHLKSFAIAFVNEKGEGMELPYVSLVCVTKGNVSYSFYDHHFLHDRDINETYEEALSKVYQK